MPPARKPEEPPEPAPMPPADSEPGWVTDLKVKLDEFGRRLDGISASVTDDDRRSIAEGVHELFERAGAFVKPPEQAEDGTEGEGEPGGQGDNPPGGREEDRTPEKKTIAERLGFPRH